MGKSAETESKGKLYEIMLEVFAWVGCVDKDLDLELRPIQIITSPIKFNLTLGSTDNLNMLNHFDQKGASKAQIYNGPVWYIIEHEWYDNMPILWVYVLATRILPLILLLFFQAHPTSATIIYLNVISSGILISFEAIQLLRGGLKSYLSEPMNVFDMVGNIFGIIWLFEFKKRCIDTDPNRKLDGKFIQLDKSNYFICRYNNQLRRNSF